MAWSAVFAAGSSGLLLGVLVGLAASPVVGSLIGGIVALLGMFLGFKDDAPASEGASSSDEPSSTRASSSISQDARRFGVGGFALACLVGVLVGLVLRTHDVLALTPKEQVQRWIDADYTPVEARAIVALKSAGIVPRGTTVQERSLADQSASSLLFSGDAAQCDRLDPSDYADARNVGAAFVSAGGGWRAFATAVDSVRDERARLSLFRAAWELVCR